MKTKEMIGWLEKMVTYYKSDREARDEIIKRLEDYEGLKSMNEGLLDFMEDISNRLKKQAGK